MVERVNKLLKWVGGIAASWDILSSFHKMIIFTQRKIHRKLGRLHLNRVRCCFGGKNEYGFWIWFTKPISEDPMLILKQQYWLNCIFFKVNSQIDVLICLLLSLYLPFYVVIMWSSLAGIKFYPVLPGSPAVL